jgi:hypothetical protein
MDNNSDLIFENYEGYLKEHQDDLSTPAGAIEMLSSDGAFQAYMTSLTEGLEPYQKSAVMAVCEREREFLLQESIQLGPSTSIIGYAVTYFPILTDIYADPVISRVATTYPTNKSIITVPKVQLDASVKNTDGTVSKYPMPRAQYLIRTKAETLNILPNQSNNLFELSAGYSSGEVNSTKTRINQRYFMLTTLEVFGDSGGDTDTTTLVSLNIRPDARGQIHKEFQFTDSEGRLGDGTLIGHVDWDSGTVQYSVTFNTVAGVTFVANYAACKCVFSPKTGDIGRVKVSIKIQGWDVSIDTREDFEIELQTETIQDYKDIYNIDLVRTMSEAIKTQILLNKDWDLAYFLEANESEMAYWGATQSINISKFMDMEGVLSPHTLVDIFKSIVPRIAMNNRIIHRNFRATPQFLVTGLRTGALLESMQNWVANIPSMTQGDVGYQSTTGNFMKQTVLTSPAINDNKIYQVYKAPGDNLSRAVIIDFIYKPLYIIEEITNSMKRTFVKSRTALEVCTPHALGVVEVAGMDDFLGPDKVLP